jgi:large subunit ribosomal protein L21
VAPRNQWLEPSGEPNRRVRTGGTNRRAEPSLRTNVVLQSEVPVSGESTVFAIIQASGRQFRVQPGAVIEINGHANEAGAELTFDQVLLVGRDAGELMAGAPFVSGAKVLGVVDSTDKTAKIRIFKKKRRKQYRRTKGHRSLITRVRITDIQV